jgi:hypothetical protein
MGFSHGSQHNSSLSLFCGNWIPHFISRLMLKEGVTPQLKAYKTTLVVQRRAVDRSMKLPLSFEIAG